MVIGKREKDQERLRMLRQVDQQNHDEDEKTIKT